MKTQAFIVSAVLMLLNGCATAPEEKSAAAETDLSQVLPPSAAGLPSSPLYFSSAEEAQKALVGYNYALTNQQDGSVQAFVSGVVGSGADNQITQVQSNAANPSNLIVELESEGGDSAFPTISLSEKKNGQAAIDALGDNLNEVANSYGMSPERLGEILRTDSTAWIDQNGRLLYIDSEHTAPQEPPKEAASTIKDSGSIATAASSTDAFALHSKPGSNRLIYLDFNGHVATNTAWAAGSLNAVAYDLDGNPGAFNVVERNNIKEIWQRVAEDYAPFDVDVTTQEPALNLLQRTSSSDVQYGTRAVITRSMPQLCGQVCGGVAYVNVFSYYSATVPDRYQPAWVFFDKLGNGYPKYVAEAASHEIGHNLNLNHDGNASTGYYMGHVNWAPIMGVGYYKTLTQWSKGEYSGAKNFQDDIAVIHAAGANLRADDYSNTLVGASVLNHVAGTVDQNGVVDRSTDVDTFVFSTSGGNAKITVTPDSVAANLDIMFKVLDAKGKIISQVNPVDQLSATVNMALVSGQYFLQVEGVGAGNLTTGYSDYGSLGQYKISGTFVPSGANAVSPTAVISASPALGNAPLTVQLNGANSSDRDGKIAAYNWNFGDGSSVLNTATISHVYKTAGNYTATLSVTDNSGLTSSTTQTIQVKQSPVSTGMKASSNSLTRKITGNNSQCVANVTLKYSNATVPNATVYGVWSGSVLAGTKRTVLSTTGKVVTNNTGVASFTGPTVPKASKGTCTFTVTNATKTGYTYEGNGVITGGYSW